MTPALVDGPVMVHLGDALEVLLQLPDESVHCVVSSPPYWGLRDYGTAQWEGGDSACAHRGRDVSHRDGVTAGPEHGTFGESRGTQPAKERHVIYRQACARCGANRVDEQLGLEATPEEYVERLVEVLREVRRVLRSDGTLWLVLGDCYNSNAGDYRGVDSTGLSGSVKRENAALRPRGRPRHAGLKPKDLVGIPWRVALALQADGWWLRRGILWAKPSALPEAGGDPPPTNHQDGVLPAEPARRRLLSP